MKKEKDEVADRSEEAANQPQVTIDAEFKVLIPPLSPMEREGLETQLLAEGCREPLIVWGDDATLIDGHNRLDICRRHGLDYEIKKIDFADREDAQNWILRNQLGRRNLGPKRLAYLRGKMYQAKRAPGKRTDLTKDEARQRAAEELAAEFHVQERTIRRDAELANQIDRIMKKCGQEAWATLLAEKTRLTNADYKRLAELPTAEAKKAMKKVAEEGRLPKPAGKQGSPKATPLARLMAAWKQADEAARRDFAAHPDVADVLVGLASQAAEVAA